MNTLRSILYWLARFIGDVQAVRRGPKAIAKRMARKAAHKAFGKVVNR